MKIKMTKLVVLFDIVVAKSSGVDDYDLGEVPLVTSAEIKNGVVAYVQPEADDRVFTGPALVISGLGFATVHLGVFLPKGNGGDSLTVLKPKASMSVEDLISIAAAFNVLHHWRLGFGRKASKNRLGTLEVPYPPKPIATMWTGENESLQKLSGYVEESFNQKISTFSKNERYGALGKNDNWESGKVNVKKVK